MTTIDRFDSEYYKKEFIEKYKKIGDKKTNVLSSIASISDGNHLSIAEEFSSDEGVRYLRGQDISGDFLIDSNPVFIPRPEYEKLSRSHIFQNDILLTIVGANTGQVALVNFNVDKLTANCKLGIVRIKERDISPAYLHTFLASQYGQTQVKRNIRGGGQTGLILPDLRNLQVVRFSKTFESLISQMNTQAHQNLLQSKSLYKQAESVLLSELGLANFTLNNENVAIKQLSESHVLTGRLDAEYYQPKYDEMLSVIKNIRCFTLGELVDIKKSIEPGSDYYVDEGIPFVRVSNLTKYGLTSPEIKIPFDTVPNIKRLFLKRDTILLSKDGTVGIAYKVNKDLDIVTSGAILHLSIKDNSILPDYLTLLLNSTIVQMQAERDAGGSIIQHWKPSEIEQVVIPISQENIQMRLSKKVQESFALKEESERLLQKAKQTVELAIEQDEQTALAWLKE